MTEHAPLTLKKSEDENDRDMIYQGIREIGEICGYISDDLVCRYNNHTKLAKALAEAVRIQQRYYGDATRLHVAMIDWEKESRSLIAEMEKIV